MAFKMMGGKDPKSKTGNGVPSSLMGGPKMKSCGGPMMHEGKAHDPVDKKKALTRDEEVQKRYPGAVKRQGTINDYDYKGVTLTPGVKKKKVLSDKKKIIKAINSKK
jgi:hypothetical protein